MPQFEQDVPRGHIPTPPSPEAVFIRRIMTAALIVILLLALWRVSLVLILTFGGILVAVALRNIAAPLGRYLRISDRFSLIITVLGLLIIFIGFFDLFGRLANQQFSDLVAQIPGRNRIRASLAARLGDRPPDFDSVAKLVGRGRPRHGCLAFGRRHSRCSWRRHSGGLRRHLSRGRSASLCYGTVEAVAATPPLARARNPRCDGTGAPQMAGGHDARHAAARRHDRCRHVVDRRALAVCPWRC